LHGLARRDRGGNQSFLDPVQLIQLALQRGNARRALRQGERIVRHALDLDHDEGEALRSDTTYIHCCTLNDTEWKLIRDTGGTISIAGYVETLMGHGNPPIQKAIDTGIRPSLSVDVETSVPNDFFQQMRTIFSLQKNEAWPPRRRQKSAEVLYRARSA